MPYDIAIRKVFYAFKIFLPLLLHNWSLQISVFNNKILNPNDVSNEKGFRLHLSAACKKFDSVVNSYSTQEASEVVVFHQRNSNIEQGLREKTRRDTKS